MRVHHINCGTMCPMGGRLFDGTSTGFGRAHLVCHCLLIETDSGLVLVDTGFGLEDMNQPIARLPRFFINLNGIQLNANDTALARVKALGFRGPDVRHIVLTHLDFDHAGGLSDFPQATVHVFETEARIARERRGLLRRMRYRPEQWAGSGEWREYKVSGENWFGFEAVRDLQGLPPEILLIPLAGHTLGHCGVAVQEDGRWLLHAGDAFFFRGEMDPNHPTAPPGAAFYERMMQMNGKLRDENQRRLRALIAEQRADVTVICSHDAMQLQQMEVLVPASVAAQLG
jgi:glyoxylase-like metal-dependent hydrolase (beta-lactamase superfamily II)